MNSRGDPIPVTWPWLTFEEYKDRVRPIEVDNVGQFRRTHWDSWFQNQEQLIEAVVDFREAVTQLERLSEGLDRSTVDRSQLDKLRQLTWDTDRLGETILLYHHRLAVTEDAADFIATKGLDQHWDRWTEGKILFRLEEYIEACQALLHGYRRLGETDANFLFEGRELLLLCHELDRNRSRAWVFRDL